MVRFFGTGMGARFLGLIFLLLSACGTDSSITPAGQPTSGSTPISAPGFDQLSRAVDTDSIEVSITLTLEDGSGQSQQINATRIGTTAQWQSETVLVPAGIPFSIEVIWSAVGVDGFRYDYAAQKNVYPNGAINDNTTIDFSPVPYSFDEFNDDGGDANNFQELVAGTPPNGPPEPDTDTSPTLQANLELIQAKTFRISWQSTGAPEFYRVLEDPDGVSGYIEISGNLNSGVRRFDHQVALYARADAKYLVQACVTDDSCVDSDALMPTGTLNEAIGYIKSSNTNAGDGFGLAVSLSDDGSTLAIASRLESSSATGVNGNQNDNSSPGAGAVYVFVRSGTAWEQQAYLKASNTDEGDQFGFTVSLSADGNTLAVSARNEDSLSIGVNGNQSDNSASNAGAAYIFTRSASQWQQQAYLKASNTDRTDQFGYSLSLSSDGNMVAVSARQEDSGASGVDGIQNDNSHLNSGAVYVFGRSGTVWQQQAYLKASNPDAEDEFGFRISLGSDGKTLAIAAPGEDSAAIGINGDQNSNSGSNTGAVYVFNRNGLVWQQQAYLKASNTDNDDAFGNVVSISADGSTLAIGTRFEDSAASGIDGNQGDNGASGAGAVYVFIRNAAIWEQQAYLKSGATDAGDEFGVRISLDAAGNTLAVSARFDASVATGVNGDQNDNSQPKAGAVFVFVRRSTVWQQQAYLKASNTGADDEFGARVSLSGDGKTLVVGVPLEDSASSGINGDQNNNSANGAGAVYVY